MNKANKDYADLLGVTYEMSLFDGGQTYRLAHATGKLTVTYYWGDDEARLDRTITRWLNSLPWPTEDDPRVVEEGVYS